MKLHTAPAPPQADQSFPGEAKMRRNTSKSTLAAKFCLLVLVALLFLAGCGNGSNSPSSPPNSTPQTTPTSGGYSIIYLLDREIQVFLAPQRR